MEFDISDRERERLAKQSSKAAAAYMEIADGLKENDTFKVSVAVLQAGLLSGPLLEQLTGIYQDMSQGKRNE